MGTNKFTLMVPDGAGNIITDDNLKLTDWDSTGIMPSETAYSNRLNTLFRQITTVTHSIADLIANEMDITVGSYAGAGVQVISETLIRDTLEQLILYIAEDKRAVRTINTIWAAPASGSAGLPSFRALEPADIPSLDTSKITSGTFPTARIANDAITTLKILDANITTAKIADANVTTAKIKDANVTEGKLATDSVVTTKIKNLNVTTEKINTYAVTETKLASDSVVTAKIKDANVTLAKLATDIYDSSYILDSLISPKHTSSRGYTVNVSNNLVETAIKHVILTQAQFNAITKEANTIYNIVG